MGVTTALRTVAIAAWLAWSATPARADGAVMVVGKVSPRDRDVIVDAIRGAATALAFRFTTALSRDASDPSMACLRDQAPWSCLSPSIRGKDQLVIVEVDSDRGGGAPMTILTAHLLTAGAEGESFASRDCAMCNEDALKRTVEALGRDLLQRAAARTGRTRLAIRSTPDRAQIVLDGKPAGATDATLATYPGKHTVEIQAPGFAPARREVVAVDGTTVDVALRLAPEPRPAAPVDRDGPGPRAEPGSRVAAGIAIGAGAAAIVAGGLLIALDQDADPSGRQHYYYDTAGYGVAALAAGAALAGAGVYLWLRPRASSVATVAPLRDGAVIGWAGRF